MSDRLSEIRARADAATPGPWTNEFHYLGAGINPPMGNVPPGKCCFCANPDAVFVCEKPDAKYGTIHIHRVKTSGDNGQYDWATIYSADGTNIIGTYDYESGGVCSTREDAAFIAASRADIDFLLSRVDALEGALRKTMECFRQIALDSGIREVQDAYQAAKEVLSEGRKA